MTPAATNALLRRWTRAMIARECFRARLVAIDDRPTQGELLRADGRCVCTRCGLPYRDHPQHPVETYATMLCDGRMVKL